LFALVAHDHNPDRNVGIRSGLFLLLVALAVLTFLGGGMQYITSLF
jgi:hypothetical protein